MKHLKKIQTMLPLLLLLVFVGCKKNNVTPDNDPVNDNPEEVKGISMDELLDYYLVTELKSGDTKLAVMYFTKEGDVVKASLHGGGYLRSKEVVATNSTFSFNSDGFGTYNYTLEKDESGMIKLKSYDFNGGADLDYALLIKKTNALPFANSSFKAGDLLFKLTSPTTLEWNFQNKIIGYNVGPPPFYIKTPIIVNGPELTLPYYSLIDLGFKTNNDQFIGITVPNWKDSNTPVMLIEKHTGPVLKAIKQP